MLFNIRKKNKYLVKESTFHYWAVSISTIIFLSTYFISSGPYRRGQFNLIILEIPTIIFFYLIECFREGEIIHLDFIPILFCIYILLIMDMLAVNEKNIFENIILITRLYGYIAVTFLFFIQYFDWRRFYKYLLYFCYASTLFAILTPFFFSSAFMDLGYYVVSRPRALLSEPSAFAPIISIIFFTSLEQKSIKGIILALIGAYVVASGTVYSVLVLLLMVYIFKKINTKYMIVLNVAIVVLLILLSCFKTPIIGYLEGSFNYPRIAKKWQNVFKGRAEKGDRAASLFNYYSVLKQDNALLTGKGFNTAKTYFGERNDAGENKEYSLVHSYLFAFGISGIIILMLATGYTFVIIWRRGSINMFIVYSAFMFSSLINSASGNILYKFVYLFVFLAILRQE